VELYLDENSLTALPDCLAEFTQLRRLTVSGNQLRWVCGCGWRYWDRKNIKAQGNLSQFLS
jgi:Leucine-rich repeat (LRR) protein